MARSQRLSLREVRAVFGLVGECRELGADVTAWRRHMVAGLCRLTGAQVGVIGEIDYSRRVPLRPLHVEDVGWSCPGDRHRVLEQFLASDLYRRDLTAKRFFCNFPLKITTVRRDQIISNTEWVRSVEFNDFVRQGGLDLGILSQQAFRCGERSNAIVLYPALGEVRMTERGRRLVHLAQQEIGPV